MPIYKGLTKIGTIYKGSTKIGKVYNGTLLVYSSAFWLSYTFTNLYNSLIPITIDGKSVKNKAKVNTIYGNSVVENQQFNTFRTVSVNGCDITPLANGRGIHIQGTAEGNQNTWVVNLGSDYTRFTNHKMLIKNNSNIVVRNNDFGRNINEIGQITGQYFVIDMVAGTQYNNDIELQLIDLTQMFPFDTPTSLDDVRVQAILNQGYIPFNAGTLKSVDIGEFSSESANLCDKTSFSVYNYVSDYNKYNSNNAVSLKKGTYTISVSRGIYLQCFKSANTSDYLTINEAISSYSSGGINWSGRCLETTNETTTLTITLTQDCIITICAKDTEAITNPMINVGSTVLPFVPHKSFLPLLFKYQGGGVNTSHDTLENTPTAWVFTKNRALVDLSSLTFGGVGNNVYYANLSTTKNNTGLNNMPNLLCGKYQTVVAKSNNYWVNDETRDKIISLGYDTNRVYVRDTSITQASDISGIIEYELATPQVIRIPKKHLAVVDLGSLTFHNFSGNVYYAYGFTPAPLVNTTNCYCFKYMTYNGGGAGMTSKGITIKGGSGTNIWIYDEDFAGKTTQEIKELLSGQYLFYETEDEVADIPFTLDIEAGGTITSNSVVLPNAKFDLKCN